MSSIHTLTVANIATTAVLTIPESLRIQQVIELFAEKRLSCLIVVNGAKPVGIITERDLLRVACSGYDENRPARAIMGAPLLTTRHDMSFAAAQSMLSKRCIRHLVLIDAAGDLFGVVSETDFRRHISQDMFESIEHLNAVMDMSSALESPDMALSEVLERMASGRLDHVIIGRDGVAEGIITERDVPKLLAQHVDTTSLPCKLAMSTPLQTIAIGCNVAEAAAKLTKTGLRHLVVVDERGKFSGIVSQHRLFERLSTALLEGSHNQLLHRVRLSEQRFQNFVENIQYPLCHVNDAGEILFINRSFSEVFGYTLDDVPTLTKWWSQAYPDPIYREWVLATWSEAVTEAKRIGCPIRSVEYRVTCKNGSIRYIEMAGIALSTGFLATFNDVTCQHEARAKADELLARLQKIAIKVPGVLCQYQQWPDGRSAFPYASPGISAIYGVTPDEVKADASAAYNVVHPDDLAQVVESIKESMRTLTTWHQIYRVVLPERGLVWLEGACEPELQPDGSVLWYGYIQDITEAKLAQEQMHVQLEELRRWQSVMVSREDRMSELKQEVNELLAAQGKPPRYKSQV